MSYRIPQPQWQQPNTSDKFGNLYRTKNVNLDEQGYIKLSPRMVRLYSNNDDANLGLTLAIGKQADGEFQIATDDANWSADLDVSNKTIAEDTGTTNPDPSFDGDGVWYAGLWHVSTATTVVSRPATGGASQAYTSRITGLTSGKRHKLAVFKSRNTICVSDGNTVIQKDSSYSASTTLTIPADFEISDIAYNGLRLGVATRLVNNGTLGQDQEAMFFVWDGASTVANNGAGVGSDAVIAVKPYQSSFVILTRAGEIKYWNGGGFQTLAAFPFFFTEHIYGDAKDNNALGSVYMEVDGDIILIHIGNSINTYSRKGVAYIEQFPAGVWCYEPKCGLYHRYSLSNSPVYLYTVTHSNVNTSTDVMTISSGTVPATGNIARLLSAAGIGGLTANYDYYIIKTGATTFKLAETREKALAGEAIDLTSATTGSNYFWMLDHKDYGATLYDYPGAVKLTGNANDNYMMFTDIIAGGRLEDTDLTSVETIGIGVPYLENVGYLVTPKSFATGEREGLQKIDIRFRPLNDDSSIVVYGRSRDVLGLPTVTPQYSATWNGQGDLSTTADLSEAEDYLGTGGAILMEIISGVGAGTLIPVTSITGSDGTYALTVGDQWYVTAADKCEFILYNFEKIGTITSADNDDGHKNFGFDISSGKFAQFLVEMRGYDVAIEDINYQNGQ